MGSIFARPPARARAREPAGRARSRSTRAASATLADVELAARRSSSCVGRGARGAAGRAWSAPSGRAHPECGPDSLNVAMAATVALYELGNRMAADASTARPSCAAEAEAAIAAAGTARRARGAARALPRPQGRADRRRCARSASCRRSSAARWARRRTRSRQALEALLDARTAELEAAELDARLAEDRDRRDAAGRPAAPGRPPAPGHRRSGARWRTCSSASASRCSRAPRSSTTTTTSPRSTTRPSTRRGCPQDTFYFAEQRAAAHPHLADADPRDGGAAAADLRRRAGPRLPARHPGRHPRADVPPARGPGDRRGHHARRPPGRAARVRPRRCSARTRGAAAAGLLPVHRAERRGRRLLLPLRRHAAGEGSQRCRTCKGEGWIEILGSGMVDPNVLGYVAGQRLRPRARAGLRVRHGHRADRDARARGAGPADALRERPAAAGAVRAGA